MEAADEVYACNYKVGRLPCLLAIGLAGERKGKGSIEREITREREWITRRIGGWMRRNPDAGKEN